MNIAFPLIVVAAIGSAGAAIWSGDWRFLIATGICWWMLRGAVR